MVSPTYPGLLGNVVSQHCLVGRTSKWQEAEDYKSQGTIGERLLVTEGLRAMFLRLRFLLCHFEPIEIG